MDDSVSLGKQGRKVMLQPGHVWSKMAEACALTVFGRMLSRC